MVFPPARHPLLWYYFFEIGIPKALDKYHVDVFFSPDGYLSLRSQVPTAMVMHDLAFFAFPQYNPWLVRKYYHHFVPKFVHRADQLITVSEYTRQDLLDRFPEKPDKVTVACNAGAEGFAPLSEAQKQKVKENYAAGQDFFFYVGALHPRKNISRLIQAFDQFKIAQLVLPSNY